MNVSVLKARDDWQSVRLADVCVAGLFRDPTQEPGKTFKYVDISGVDNQTKRIVSVQTIVGRDAPSRARKVIRVGDVLVANVRPNLNAIALVPAELDNEICSTGFTVLRPSERIDADYLLSFVRSESFVRPLSDLVKGALYPAVTDKQVLGIEIPLPELVEQKRIAAILNEQMAAVEMARAAAESQVLEASSLARRYLLRVFGALLNSAPQVRSLVEVAQLLPSKSISTDGEATVEAVTTACLTETGFDRRGTKTARMAANDVSDCILGSGEILVARSNTPELVGRAAMFPGYDSPIVASDLTIRIKGGPELLPEFLAGYFSYLYVSKYWVERAGGASGTMKKITRTQISELPIPVPALDIQRRVVEQLGKATSAARQVEAMVASISKEIDRLSPAFLRRAFSGQF